MSSWVNDVKSHLIYPRSYLAGREFIGRSYKHNRVHVTHARGRHTRSWNRDNYLRILIFQVLYDDEYRMQWSRVHRRDKRERVQHGRVIIIPRYVVFVGKSSCFTCVRRAALWVSRGQKANLIKLLHLNSIPRLLFFIVFDHGVIYFPFSDILEEKVTSPL